jgi:hypothetical protein
MANIKITELPSGESVSDDDIFVFVDSPNYQPITKKVSAATFRSSILNQQATLQVRQGLNSERILITPSIGEPVWTTDTKKLYIGDSFTVGGIVISSPIYETANKDIVSSSGDIITGSGNICIGSNGNNTIIGTGNLILGGDRSIASGIGIISIGPNNLGSGTYSSVLGGSRNGVGSLTAFYNCIINGQRNTSITTYGFIGNGSFNTVKATSQGYASIVNGFANSTTSDFTFIGNGYTNTATADYSNIVGGRSNMASGIYSSILGGQSAKTTLNGEIAHAAGSFASAGDAQRSTVVLRTETTNNTSNVILTSNGSSSLITSPSNTTSRNFIYLPDKTTLNFNIQISAYNDTDTSAAIWNFVGGIKRGVGASTTALIQTPTEASWKDAGMTSALSSIVADTTNGGLSIRVTGLTGKNIRWVAIVDYCQVSYGTP